MRKTDQKRDRDPIDRERDQGLKEIPNGWKQGFRNQNVPVCPNGNRCADRAIKQGKPANQSTAQERESLLRQWNFPLSCVLIGFGSIESIKKRQIFLRCYSTTYLALFL